MAGNQLATRDTPLKDLTASLAKTIESRSDAFKSVAGKNFSPERLIKLAQGALARTPDLAKCQPASVLVALMRCAELELEPDSAMPQRRMWLVPRWNAKIGGMECTYVMDYRAQIQKARETGMVSSVVASEVRKNDKWSLTFNADGTSLAKFMFEPTPGFGDRGEVIGYFAAARLDGGEVQHQ